MTRILIILFSMFSFVMYSQQKKIKIIHSDNTFIDEIKYPGAIVALGNVMLEHEGATLQSKQALIYQKANIVKAFGDVLIKQGDTITQTSKYVDYNGNTKVAKSWGNVVLKDPKMTLTTDTLRFDRKEQLLYYDDHATITDFENKLNSKIGKYFLKEKKFQAMSNVVITNPDHTVTSDHLDYFTNTGKTYLYGPSTIKDSVNTLYCENGYHDSRNKISIFTKNSKINYETRILEGDSLYYDKLKQYAAATGNIKVTDTVNKTIVRGHYSQYFENKDSLEIVGKPYAINIMEKDSMFIHGDTLLVTGKKEERVLRAFHHVKFYKSDIQGKCDSLISIEKTGITKMYRRPVLWNEKNQITGDTIHFLTDTQTDKIDSLKVYNNTFLISKDTILKDAYSQIKGKFLFGKFVKDTLDNVLISGNGQMINYNRDDKKELMGISKIICSDLSFKLRSGKMHEVKFISKPDGKTYPLSQFPKEESKFPEFEWREAERPKIWEDIFLNDEGDDEKIKNIINAEKQAKIDEAIRIKEAAAKAAAEEKLKLESETKKTEEKLEQNND